jgi:hypothetical protein
MTLTELQSLIGDLTNDPVHDRYSLTQINTELDNWQDKWNVEAKILKDTVTLTVVDGTRQYALSSLTGTPIAFTRVAHKGLALEKKDKAWFDLYAGGVDWTTTPGTPTDYFIEATDPDLQYVTLYPTPQSGDAGAYLVVEYIKKHTSMSASSDTPFNAAPLLRPYDWGGAYDVASRLLVRDPNPTNAQKVMPYKKIADDVMADVIQVFKAFEKQVPMRLKSIYRPVGRQSSTWRQYW